jgi:hypothetical protein
MVIMMKWKWRYGFEDHTYKTQQKAYVVLTGVICRPGHHKWRFMVDDEGPQVCDKCRLMRWKNEPDN